MRRDCWWFRNVANQLSSLSYYLQGFSTIQTVVVWDFWTINRSLRFGSGPKTPKFAVLHNNPKPYDPSRHGGKTQLLGRVVSHHGLGGCGQYCGSQFAGRLLQDLQRVAEARLVEVYPKTVVAKGSPTDLMGEMDVQRNQDSDLTESFEKTWQFEMWASSPAVLLQSFCAKRKPMAHLTRH